MSKKKSGNNGSFRYDKYQMKHLMEQRRLRAINANNRFRELWKKVCLEHRDPKRERIAAFFYPPLWYRKLILHPVRMLEKVVWLIVLCYSWITVNWMYWIHKRVFLNGVTKKVFISRPGYRKIVIKVHGKVVEELELPV